MSMEKIPAYQSITIFPKGYRRLAHMETHLTEEIHCEDVSRYVHISSFHFQRMFNLLTGMTVGEYIRKRRLSLAGEELTSLLLYS